MSKDWDFYLTTLHGAPASLFIDLGIGPDIVALSFFGTPVDMNDGGPEHHDAIASMFAADAAEPADPDLAVFWRAEHARHPRLHRMDDLLGCAFALILLTQEDYSGALCEPPVMAPNEYRDTLPRPGWLSGGAAWTYWTQREYRFIRDSLGGITDADVV